MKRSRTILAKLMANSYPANTQNKKPPAEIDRRWCIAYGIGTHHMGNRRTKAAAACRFKVRRGIRIAAWYVRKIRIGSV